MKTSFKPLILLFLILGSCAKNREPSTINDERVALLTGYSLQSLQDDFMFEGRLFHRDDLSAERSYVFFKAFKIEVREVTPLYVSQLAILSECDLPEFLQASLRIPETYDVIALNSKVERDKALFMDSIEKGSYILTLGLLNGAPCESGFEVGLSLSDSPTERIKPVRPSPATNTPPEAEDVDTVEAEQPREDHTPITDRPLADTPEIPNSGNPESPAPSIIGNWEQAYISNGRSIKQIRQYSQNTLEKIVYDQNLLTEDVMFSVKFSPDQNRYEATVTEVKVYKYSPAKYRIGDTYLCSYELKEKEGLDHLRYSCATEIYPENIPQNYASYKRKL